MVAQRRKSASKPAGKTSQKSTRKKTGAAARKTARPRARRAGQAPSISTRTPEQRHQLIAETAYYIALKKGFEKSDPLKNWLEAEKEVDG